MATTPFQTGGGGTNFEQNVQGAFLLSFVIRLPLPMLQEGEVSGLLFQARSRGYQTDDLLIEASDTSGSRRLLVQVKHKLVFSERDEIFVEVIKGFWTDFNNTGLFDQTRDKLVIATGSLSMQVKSHLITLLNYARTSAAPADFFARARATQTKSEQLELFASVLKKLNSDITVLEDVLWSFLRCMAVLEFDFSSDTSKDRAYCLQMIKLSKQASCSQTEISIWDSLVGVCAKFNSNGGYINSSNLKDVVDVSCFDLNYINAFYGYLSKLMRDSRLVMEPIKDNIQGLRFEMAEAKEMLVSSTNQHQLTVVTGIPGAGKSALVKSVIREGIADGYVVLKADQLQSSTLAGTLSAQGIHCTVEDLFSCLSLFSNPIIFIESAEKLLEGDFGNAFSQLVAFLEKNNDVRIVLTVRSYAVDLITQRYMLPTSKLNTVTVTPLSDTDLQLSERQFPVLAPLIQHSQIKELLRSPKYLALALLTVQREQMDVTGITMSSFKAKLWSAVIEDGTLRSSGISNKRQKAFYSIALKRARSMSLFVEPDDSLDDAAIEALENDEVLYRNGTEFTFAPAHDIFEDWALVRYVSQVYKKFSQPIDFFRELGHEPAVRRALRLWVEDSLQENSKEIFDLLRNTINEPKVEKYWADELLIAVFRSKEAASFFTNFTKELLDNNCVLLARSIHLLRTCCREMSSSTRSTSNEPIPMPVGSGWPQCLLFINQHSDNVEPIKPTVLNFLSDWELRFIFSELPLDVTEIEAAKSLTLRFIGQIEKGEKFWKERDRERQVQQMVDGLFRISGFAKDETEALIKRSMKKGDEAGWRVSRTSGELYNTVLRKILGGINSNNICFLFPDMVMEICRKSWRYRKPPLPKDADEWTRMMYNSRGHSTDTDQHWAIKDRHQFFPPGIHKIPVYNLLRAYPEKALKFIIDFVNTSVAYYAAGEYDYKHHLEKVTMLGQQKDARKIWGAKELWTIYRGMSVTSYLLESLLKSLEKYLLELCARNNPKDKENIRAYFDFIYANTNSVAPISVLASVTMAYPEVVGDAMIPLLSIPEAYSWDFNRRMEESGAMTIYDSELPWFAHEEKVASKALPHRTKNGRGLSDFIINFQFNNRSINTELFRLFDRMKKLKSIRSSVVYKKLLTEIDSRKWKAREYSEELGGFPITPEYDAPVKEMMAEGKELVEQQNQASHFSQMVKGLYDSPDKSKFDEWKSAYGYFEKNDKQDMAFDRMALFVIIGLRDFNDQLTDNEWDMCVGLLFMVLNNLIKEIYHWQIEQEDEAYNPLWEIPQILHSIHILAKVLEGSEHMVNLAAICVYLLKVPFEDHRIKDFAAYFRKEVMSQHTVFGKKVWQCMVELSAWQKKNAVQLGPRQQDDYHQFQVKEQEFIYAFLRAEPQPYQQSAITFETHDAATAVIAMQLIPFSSDDSDFVHYVPMVVKEILNDTVKDSDTDHDWSGRNKKVRRIPNNLLLPLEGWLSGYVLFRTKENASQLFVMILGAVHKSEKLVDKYGGSGLYAFAQSIFDGITDQLDLKIEESEAAEANSNIVAQFWLVWSELADQVQQKPSATKNYFYSTMLFDSKHKWSDERRNFPAFPGHADKFEAIAKVFGKHSPGALLRVLSTIGAEALLPDGLQWLRSAAGDDPKQKEQLGITNAERLSELLYRHHILTIKSQPTRLLDFLWLLELMIEKGSSRAYLIRENVITYKSVSA